MDIDKVPQPVWDLLAKKAVEAATGKKLVVWEVWKDFYHHIYRRWTIDFQQLDYTSNLTGVKDVGWKEVAEMWKKGFAEVLAKKDKSKGSAVMQTQKEDVDHRATRLGEKYSEEPTVSRFQFLVSAGGGLVLLNRMRRACHMCMAKKDTNVVQWWKVFGESFADQGQSDACVVYLLQNYNDPLVIHFIKNYLWPNIKDIVNDKFIPVGLEQIDNKPLWGIWIPDKTKWTMEFGRDSVEGIYGSAGGLMGLVFGKAFAETVSENPNFGAEALIQPAKANCREILARLK